MHLTQYSVLRKRVPARRAGTGSNSIVLMQYGRRAVWFNANGTITRTIPLTEIYEIRNWAWTFMCF